MRQCSVETGQKSYYIEKPDVLLAEINNYKIG